jgi:hypothetical protein
MLTDFAKGLMLDALDETATNGIKFWSLHTAFSATGTNEVTGGSPAYARKAAVYAAATGSPRHKDSSAGQTFDVPATTVAWIGRWDAVTTGNFLGMGPAGGAARRQFGTTAAGVTANTIDSPAHGFSAGNAVVFWAAAGAVLPSPLAEGTIYFVIATGLTTDVFSVSTTLGGSAVDLTTVGDGEVQLIVPETFAGQGQYNMTGDIITLP